MPTDAGKPIIPPTAASRFFAVVVEWEYTHNLATQINWRHAGGIEAERIHFDPWPEEGSADFIALQAMRAIYASEEGFRGADGNRIEIIMEGRHRTGLTGHTLESVVALEGGFNPLVPGSYESWVAAREFYSSLVQQGVQQGLRNALGAEVAMLHESITTRPDDAAALKIQERRLEVFQWLDRYFRSPIYNTMRSDRAENPGNLMHMRMVMLGRVALMDKTFDDAGWAIMENELLYDPYTWRKEMAPNRPLWQAQTVNGEFQDMKVTKPARNSRPGVEPALPPYGVIPIYRPDVTEDDVWMALGYMPGTPTISHVPPPAPSP